MILHWRFDTLRMCFIHFSRSSHSSSWLRLSRFDRSRRDNTKHVASAALEIFGRRNGPESSSSTACWILDGDRVKPYRSIPPTIGSGRRYVLTKMKKVPASAVYRSRNSHAKNLFDGRALSIFRLPFTLDVFTDAFSFLPPPTPSPRP